MRRRNGLSAFVIALTSMVAGAASADQMVEIASLGKTGPITVLIQTTCNGEDPVFRLVNTGPSWPRLAKVRVSRTNDSELLFDRSMRMKNGQKASIRLPIKRVGPGEYSIAVLPTWYDRGTTADATLSCN